MLPSFGIAKLLHFSSLLNSKFNRIGLLSDRTAVEKGYTWMAIYIGDCIAFKALTRFFGLSNYYSNLSVRYENSISNQWNDARPEFEIRS